MAVIACDPHDKECISRQSIMKTGNIGRHTLFQDSMPLKLIKPLISEDVKGVGRVLRLGGQFQYADRPNANGRIYPKEILEHAVTEIQSDLKSRRVMGEFDHPPDAKIHLDRVSHILTDLKMKGSEVIGELEVLEKTPMGSIAKALIESKVQLGISSRGVGDMETTIHEGNEFYKVLPGFTFVTFDIVAEPSVQGSYLNINESRDRILKKLRQFSPKCIREEAEHKIVQQFKAFTLRRYLEG
jgi:hypothetical protein